MQTSKFQYILRDLMFRPKRTNFGLRFLSAFPFSSSSDSTYLNFVIDFFLFRQVSDLQSVLRSHAVVITAGNSDNVFIASKLISVYASFNKLNFCTGVFGSAHPKDVFLWNSIIQSHFSNGNYPQALDFFIQMRASSTLPSEFTIPMVVSTCAELMLSNCGLNIHGMALKMGLFGGNSAVCSSFIYIYSKCGRMRNAHMMFDEMPLRDVVAWTALIVGYVLNDESDKGLMCLRQMHKTGNDCEKPNFRTLAIGFQACGDSGALMAGKCFHSLLVKSGIKSCQIVQSSIFSMYCKCGSPADANLCFYELSNKDLISWTSIIAIHAKFGLTRECISFFSEMEDDKVVPDDIVVSCMLSGFANFVHISDGKAFHGLIIRRGYLFSSKVDNAILNMYCKFGFLFVAEKLFEKFEAMEEEHWNTMIVGYYNTGFGEKSIELFRDMNRLGIESNPNSLVSVISTCSQVGTTRLMKSIHCCLIKSLKIENNLLVNSLIDMYGKNGNLTSAWRIFCRARDCIVAWNTMISCYMHSWRYAEAVTLFEEMISKDLKPSPVTCLTILSACTHLVNLEKGEKVRLYMKENGIEINLSLGTALINMYAKCGKLEKSRKMFESMEEKDVVCWNVMISGYAMHGDTESAVEVFETMEKSDVKPDELTFLALLSACMHSGSVEEGRYLFDKMLNYSLKPSLKHFSCMVDLLGRAGNLQEAKELALSMPLNPDSGVWGTLLSACKIHNEVEMGARIAEKAIESDPGNDGYYVILANLYDSSGWWEEAENVRKMMKKRGVAKRVGWSAV